MKLLFLSQHAHPGVGGIENLQWQVATELAACGHAVRILAETAGPGRHGRLDGTLRSYPSFGPVQEAGVRVEQLRIPRARRAGLTPLLADVLPGTRRFAYGRMRVASGGVFARVVAPLLAGAAQEADLVHVWGGDRLALAGIAAARRAGRPVLLTPFAHEGQWGDDPASARAYRQADGVVGLLEADAALLARLAGRDDHVHVVGVCSPGAGGDAAAGAALRERHGIRGPLVLFLGVRRPYKGFDALLEAAPVTGARVPDATFAFVGPGDPIGQDGHGVRVVDAGLVDDAERAAWLHAADVLCLPSQGEIFPVSILEAFSTGCAVVTSDIATLRELTARSGGGLAVARDPRTLGTALADLLADPERLRALGEAGRRFWADGHTPAAIAGAYARLYGRLVEHGR